MEPQELRADKPALCPRVPRWEVMESSSRPAEDTKWGVPSKRKVFQIMRLGETTWGGRVGDRVFKGQGDCRKMARKISGGPDMCGVLEAGGQSVSRRQEGSAKSDAALCQ